MRIVLDRDRYQSQLYDVVSSGVHAGKVWFMLCTRHTAPDVYVLVPTRRPVRLAGGAYLPLITATGSQWVSSCDGSSIDFTWPSIPYYARAGVWIYVRIGDVRSNELRVTAAGLLRDLPQEAKFKMDSQLWMAAAEVCCRRFCELVHRDEYSRGY